MSANAFGARIRDLRKARGMTIRDLATATGIDFTYVSKIENGHESSVREETIRQMAHVLAASPEADRLVFMSGKIPKWIQQRILDDPGRIIPCLFHDDDQEREGR